MVPVVLGANFTGHSIIAPPHSYISADDFSSPKALAEYLSWLSGNPEEYLSYFWWKDYYDIVESAPHILCQLCKRLHRPQPPTVIKDFKAFWETGRCRPKGSHPWSKYRFEGL